MHLMGIIAIYQQPKTTIANKEHKKYPYLLRNLVIDRPNQVWHADTAYILIKKSFLYLVAIMDWHTRKVLSWRISNTMDTGLNFIIQYVHIVALMVKLQTNILKKN